MSTSIITYLDLNNNLHIIDSSSLPHFNEPSKLMLIAVEVIMAGFNGVKIDEHRLSNGRFFQTLNTKINTPEGQIISRLCDLDQSRLPTPETVLEDIRQAYLCNIGVA